jgi:hypothetical protein
VSKHRRPVLVTGAHRSGTTWVGKMLAAGGEAAYISEPLNVLHRPGVMLAPVNHWYSYICKDNEASYLAALNETLRFHYHALAEIKSLRSRKDALRMGRDLGTFLSAKLRRQRPLLKDPFAVFSVPWFIRRLNCQVVIVVRHPAAFASSLKRLGWNFDFADILQQPLLMRDWLEPYREEMREMQQCPQDVIGQGSLLWNMVYQTVAHCRERFPQIRVVRHEDLSLDPPRQFQSLYEALGLTFNPRARKAILNSSSSENPSELSYKSVHAVYLNSHANLQNWKKRLDAQEIARLRELTQATAADFYPQASWE